ncbi:single-stranded DNA-binding protein [Galactobacter sp.]|uniref:single-stranded DNA-binding protein n=1 Tax=Galactobacter sp. TaxID=2676125 RepID=UPI0025C0E66B|nr:single-stranded DNA-binding protein [Galactobacter sp.]
MTSTNIIIRGRAGADAEGGVSTSGKAWARVRVAVTERFRGADGTWVDGNTTWYSVSCFNELARNVLAGVKIGDPVVATGSFTVEEWVRETDGARFLTPTLRAVSMGHDMSLGLSNFARRPRPEEAKDEAEHGAQDAGGGEGRPDNVDANGVILGTTPVQAATVGTGFIGGPPAPPTSGESFTGETGAGDGDADKEDYGVYSASSAASAHSAA